MGYKGASDKTCRACRDGYLRLRIRVINLLGGRCVRCGFSDWRALQVDHIHGGGNKQLKETGRYGYQRLMDILVSVASEFGEYQLLCANCNQIKRWDSDNERIGVSHVSH